MKLIQQVKRRMGSGNSSDDKKQADSKKKSPASSAPTKRQQSADEMAANNNGILPKLNEVPLSERTALFRRKIIDCQTVYNFSKDTQQQEKEAKRQTLLEMVEYVNNTRNAFQESVMQEVVNMVAANIFRSLPRRDDLRGDDPDDEEPNLEKSWPHLQFVYEFFLRFVVSNDVDPKVAKKFVDQTFMLKWLELFDTDDPRERDYLKTVLHRVYGKFMSLRSFIRRGIQHTFFKVIYESEYHSGVSELLEILGSIISGFALPLKEEHKDFLTKALIPLHKVRSLGSFHQQLSYCMGQYVDKDLSLAYDVIASMLRFWPVGTTSKQVIFLNMLEETLELTQPPEFLKMQEMLFRRIGSCISSPQFQVAERTLFLWNNDYLVKLINQHRAGIFPMIIGPLYVNSQSHWNQAVHGLSFSVLKLLMDADASLFETCTTKQRQETSEEEGKEGARKGKWKQLADNIDEKLGKGSSVCC